MLNNLGWNVNVGLLFGNGVSYGSNSSSFVYIGVFIFDRDGNLIGNNIIEGYFWYNFMDSEFVKLFYVVGSYLGIKKIFVLGIGFFVYFNGMFNEVIGEYENVIYFVVDVFLDMLVMDGDCFNVYVFFMSFNYGDNYVVCWVGMGSVLYGYVGYKFFNLRFMFYIVV